jgi:hypothetical protein
MIPVMTAFGWCGLIHINVIATPSVREERCREALSAKMKNNQ